jgi:hypothetical protein
MFFSLEDALRVHQSQGWRYETGIVIVLKNHVKTSQCPFLREGDLELIYKYREKIKKMSTFPKKNAHDLIFNLKQIMNTILPNKKSVLYLQLRNHHFRNGHFGTKLKVYEVF